MEQVRTQEIKAGEVILYKGTVEVRLEEETVWLTQAQMSELFRVDRSVITKHIHNILKSKELKRKSVCAKFAHTAVDGKVYQTQFYNLDMILSVGYRINSKRGTQFRIWATNVLREHLTMGYTLNKKLLKKQQEKFVELKRTVQLLGDVSSRKALTSDEARNLFQLVKDYSYALDVLDDYDHDNLTIENITRKELFLIHYEEAISIVSNLRKKYKNFDLFGLEKDSSFRSSIATIYQTYQGKELYRSVEEKAANLLYFIVKNHSFVDGNKRIAAAIFLYFLERNRILYHSDGSKKIADNALVAMTLMIAESAPKEKKTIVKLVVNLINKKN